MLSTRDLVLLMLEQSRGACVSGEKLAIRCGVSRCAIWKAVGELRARGFRISAGTNRGYRLEEESPSLHIPGILAWQEDASRADRMHLYPSLPSTSQTLGRMALEGAPDGTVVIAQEQTAGRGRMGRSFFSPKDCGVYLSVLIRPGCRVQDAPLFTLAACVAVCRAIESVTPVSLQIKWVNDIFLNGKKVCGIMTESVTGLESGRMESIVVGVGVNVTPPAGGFPEELSGIAGALEPQGKSVSLNRLCAALLKELGALEELRADPGMLEEYRARSLLTGREVQLCMEPEQPSGTVIGIDDGGRLMVRLKNERLLALRCGEVKLKGDFYETKG